MGRCSTPASARSRRQRRRVAGLHHFGQRYCFADSHAVAKSFNRPTDPPGFALLGDWGDETKPTFGPNDVLFAVGYAKAFSGRSDPDIVARAKNANATMIWSTGGSDGKPPAEMPAGALFIDQGWPDGDSIVEFPGYDVKVLPSSGVIQTLLYGMVCAETLEPRAASASNSK